MMFKYRYRRALYGHPVPQRTAESEKMLIEDWFYGFTLSFNSREEDEIVPMNTLNSDGWYDKLSPEKQLILLKAQALFYLKNYVLEINKEISQSQLYQSKTAQNIARLKLVSLQNTHEYTALKTSDLLISISHIEISFPYSWNQVQQQFCKDKSSTHVTFKQDLTIFSKRLLDKLNSIYRKEIVQMIPQLELTCLGISEQKPCYYQP